MKKNFLLLFVLHFAFISNGQQINTIENAKSINEQINQFLSSTSKNNRLDFYKIKTQKPDYKFKDDIIYWGDIKNDMPNGFGIRFLEDTLFFIGEYVNGKRNGYGIRLGNNELYIGQYIDDNYSGFGSLYLLNDSIYFERNLSLLLDNKISKIIEPANIYKVFTGIFSNMDKEQKLQEFEGKAIMYNLDSGSTTVHQIAKKTGKYIGGTMVGDGILEIEYPNPNSTVYGKIIYIGDIKEGPKGNLVAYSVDRKSNQSTKYEGVFTSRTDFKGKMISPDGMVSEGQFNNFILEGQGKRVCNEYDYIGSFNNNNFSGKGIVKYKDESKYSPGSYFDGIWNNGQAVEGMFYNAETQEYMKGAYINGQLNGKVTITLNGKTSIVIYKNGEKQN